MGAGCAATKAFISWHVYYTFEPAVMRILFHHLFSFSRTTCISIRKLSSVAQINRAMTARLEETKLAEKMPTIYSKFLEIKQTPEIEFLDTIFTEGGHEIRMAGGAVRDLLTGVIPSDIDFATTATPIQMEQILSAHPERIRLIATKSGVMHGTITARIDDKVQYEITTLRIDKKTDGRHAEVEFIQDWQLDASRRDLTINAMFLDLKGTLHDYYGGAHDLASKTIKFVGDPNERIVEDYLRILRYFRFYVRYGSHVRHDEATIKAIIDKREGLTGISGERIWSEMKKILTLFACNLVMPVMLNQCQIAPYMGLTTGQIDLSEFNTAHHNLHMEKPAPKFKPATLLVSLIKGEEEMYEVIKRLKMSNLEKETMQFILFSREKRDIVNLDSLKRSIALFPKTEQKLMKDSTLEFLRYIGRHDITSQLEEWPIPQFPISGYDLRSKVTQLKHLGLVIDYLKQIWANSEFTLSQEQTDAGIKEALDKIATGELGQKKQRKQSK